MMDLSRIVQLYLVADPDQCDGPFLPAVEAALRGGVTAVQLRAKALTDREAAQLGRELRAITKIHGAPLLINDRVDVALAIDADGAHLGVQELSPRDTRRIAPDRFIIGYSPDDPDDDAGADADYLGIGPVYGTVSKADAGVALGLDAFRRRIEAAKAPVVGIGGIDAVNAADVIRAEAVGVAVISSILRQPDPEQAARALRQAIEAAR